MGFLRRIFERRDLSPSDPRGWSVLGAVETASGVAVDHDRAIGLSEVYAAVRNVSEDLGALPLPAYERQGDGGRNRADDHWLAELVDDSPNPFMTSQELRESMQGQAELRGSGYAEIERNGAGRPVRLWPLRSDLVDPFVGEQGNLYYKVGFAGNHRVGTFAGQILPARLVLHVHGFGPNGLQGYDPIAVHREGVAHALALQEYGSRFFGNGSKPGGILTHPGKVSKEAKKNMRESWELANGGLQQAHRIAILEEGVSYHQVGLAPENAQFIESKKLKISDAARIWRLPPHMLGDLERATFSNIEHQGLEYVIYSLLPRAKRFEGRVRLSLLMGQERRRVFVEHLFAGLLRGDIKTRYASYALARQWGWLSVNDIRRLENMNPIGPEGDVFLSPLNMTPAGQAADPDEAPEAVRGAEEIAELLAAGRNGTH